MSRRDEKLAAKYAAKGMKSATETAREKEAAPKQSFFGRSKPAATAVDPMDAMRAAAALPRTQESKDRAKAHKRSLGPLPK